MKEIVKKLMDKNEYTEPFEMSLQMILDGQISTRLLNERLLDAFSKNISDIKSEAIRFILDFAEMYLCDNVITDEELKNMRMLKLFFRIEDNELLVDGNDVRIKKMLSKQFEMMYFDNKIDSKEAEYKVRLQELFNLSYDQFLSFEKDAVKSALEKGAKISELDTYYKI